jgi:SAM-dependent methyltransferase
MYGTRKQGRHLPDVENRCSAYELDRIFRNILPMGVGNILIEMGCGGSTWLPQFAGGYGYNVIGIDYSEEGCNKAQINLEKGGCNGLILCKDFLVGPTCEVANKADVVISFGVVEHFKRPAEILAHFMKFGKEDGYIVTYVPNFSGIMGWLLKRINPALYMTHQIYSLKDLESYHRASGMRIMHSSYLEFMDFSILPIDGFPSMVSLLIKNIFHVINRFRLIMYRTLRLPAPQSEFLCATMIVIGKKEKKSEGVREHGN